MTLDGTVETQKPARILVVDDNRISGRKLMKAVKALGHQAEIVPSGADALARLRESPSDIVLLDILMPGMDGYAVLDAMKSDHALRDIPVIVVSSLEDEIGSVARAIELGAEDFLPKSFELTILRARINASLARKRFRDREIEYFRDIEHLTQAAKVIESGAFRPEDMDVGKVAARSDPLGRLAVVFHSLAEEIFDREQRHDLTVRTLRGMLLVLAAGGIFGMAPALGRLAAELTIPPIGLVFWSNLIAAITCLAYSTGRRGLPRVRREDIRFILLWALVLGCMYQLATVFIAIHVQATTIALVGSTRGFMVFLLAAIFALERPTLVRFLGLGVGFAAVVFVMLLQGDTLTPGDAIWLSAAFILPFLLSVHTMLMAWRPTHIDAAALVGLMLAISAVVIAPFAMSREAFFVPDGSSVQRDLIVIGLGLSTAVALTLALDLVSTAGAVFASQMAYSQTIAGIFWGMIFLGENLSPLAWASLGLVILGFWLVKPRRAGSDFRVRLELRDRGRS